MNDPVHTKPLADEPSEEFREDEVSLRRISPLLLFSRFIFTLCLNSSRFKTSKKVSQTCRHAALRFQRYATLERSSGVCF